MPDLRAPLSMALWYFYTCLACMDREIDYREQQRNPFSRLKFGGARVRAEQVWACGGGTQSGAIATLISTGKLPRPDFAFMTDTGRERSSTWPFVNGFIRPALASVDLELTIVKAEDFACLDIFVNETILLPGFTTINGSVGKLSPFCSGKWKRDVAERWMRSVRYPNRAELDRYFSRRAAAHSCPTPRMVAALVSADL